MKIFSYVSVKQLENICTFHYLNSKCDSIGCTRECTLFRVFRGCGHSFHVECNLPDVSVCQVCKAFLTKRIEILSETANKAVKEFNGEELDGEECGSDEEEIECDEEDEDEELHEPITCEQTVSQLLNQINTWRRVEGPRQ